MSIGDDIIIRLKIGGDLIITYYISNNDLVKGLKEFFKKIELILTNFLND